MMRFLSGQGERRQLCVTSHLPDDLMKEARREQQKTVNNEKKKRLNTLINIYTIVKWSGRRMTHNTNYNTIPQCRLQYKLTITVRREKTWTMRIWKQPRRKMKLIRKNQVKKKVFGDFKVDRER